MQGRFVTSSNLHLEEASFGVFLFLIPLLWGATGGARAQLSLGGTKMPPPPAGRAVAALPEAGTKGAAAFPDGWIPPAATVVALD